MDDSDGTLRQQWSFSVSNLHVHVSLMLHMHCPPQKTFNYMTVVGLCNVMCVTVTATVGKRPVIGKSMDHLAVIFNICYIGNM